MQGPVCLIVNPHAGGGRALRLLPGVEAELRGQGRQVVVERSPMGGYALTGPIAGELREKGLLAVFPGGRGNDFARKLGIPFDPVLAARLLQSGVEKRVDLATAN